jgi:cell division protein FtsB
VPSLRDLPIAGLTRRRVAFGLSVLVTAWIVFAFARQVSEAQAATARADLLASENTALAGQVEDLADELDLVQREAFIRQEARAYRLGGTDEIAFRLEPDAPELPGDAPGSAAVRLGAATRDSSPLESWLSLLFGPTPGD